MSRIRLRVLQPFFHHPELARVRRWARIFIEFSVVQTCAQLLGMVTGIIVVRLLVPHQYALYTIANSVLGSLVVLADSGISGAIAGIGGRIWQDPHQLGQTVIGGRKLMRRMRNVFCIPTALSLAWLLIENQASATETAVIVTLVLIGAIFATDSEIFVVVARLLGNMRLLQSASLGTAAFRLLSIVPFSLVGLTSETAMLVVVLGYGAQYCAIRRFTRGAVALDRSVAPGAQAELKSVVARQLPNTLYFVFQSQISIWLLSIFGSAQTVADLGALTRISVIFAVLLTAMQSSIIPPYSRCQDPDRLWILYFQICAGFLMLALIPVVVVWLAPQPILWVLGDSYRHLPAELILATLSASLGCFVGLTWALNANRAWFPPSWISIPIGLSSQLALVLLIGVSTVRQVLLVAILASMVQLVANGVMTAMSIKRFRRQSRAASFPDARR